MYSLLIKPVIPSSSFLFCQAFAEDEAPTRSLQACNLIYLNFNVIFMMFLNDVEIE